MQIIEIAIAELNPAPYNPRTISGPVLERLKKGLQEYGFVEPLVVNQRGNRVVGGHQRLRAAQELGMTTVPVCFVDLDEPQEKALNLALNKLSGDWDYDRLTTMLTEFEAMPDFDLELTGFDTLESTELVELAGFSEHAGATGGGEGDDENPEPTATSGNYVIQYNLIFNDEGEQRTWHQHLRALKDKYPDMDTVSERIIADIEDRAE